MNLFKQPQKGRNEWWRYLIGVAINIVIFLVISIIVSFLIYDLSDLNHPKAKEGLHPVLFFVFSMVPHVCGIIILALVVKFLHQRPFLSLFNTTRKLEWHKVFRAAWVFGLLLALSSIGNYLLDPNSIVFSFDAKKFLPFLVAVLLITPLQTTSEELFFRAYLLQWTGKIKSLFILSFINGILFMIPHLNNPEMAESPTILAIIYFSMGFFLAYITLKSNGLEYAIGVHAINNLFCALVLNLEVSVLQTESVFTITKPAPLYDLISMWVIGILFYFVVVKPKKKINDDAVLQ